MTCRDSLKCIHEPFGDAFYYGPERLSERYEASEQDRVDSGFSETTYKTVVDRIEREASEGKRLFIKDITHYLVPPNGEPASIAPSLTTPKKGVGTVSNGEVPSTETDGIVNGASKQKLYPFATHAEPGNPTVVPDDLLSKFHFTFLIRHPRRSIPSYYRCTIPPLDAVTGFYDFMPSEAGYDEVRRVFDYLRTRGHIGPAVAGRADGVDGADGKSGLNGVHDVDGVDGADGTGDVEICVVDADDLLDNPAGIIEAYCRTVGLPYDPAMLTWDTEVDHEQAREAFEKWRGFHNDAIESTALRPREHKTQKPTTPRDLDAQWTEQFGAEGAKIIRETVDRNVADYEYLKSFALEAVTEKKGVN
ncbi:MAG: hypothetical protein M1833_002039 [Piccolia ochrophora]|nr:MAG: hypothetical protein M1833_002039 [Piccolia ochrophora]